jgi:galactofuranosylgalactofuranosylrhamnosyl-N-acetylglucosaminyl-diphospho-decaprenol beta-1,5/1,6-galactofuranosyltransferase
MIEGVYKTEATKREDLAPSQAAVAIGDNYTATGVNIKTITKDRLFIEGFLATDTPGLRETVLAIIVCTFNNEIRVAETINKLIRNSDLKKRQMTIFLVDNGRTLNPDEFDDSRIRLILNRNVGGSGGFTRGLMAALDEGGFTHALFMDDDIDLFPESIIRLMSFWDYAMVDVAVSGILMDIDNRHILYESGAKYCGIKKGAFSFHDHFFFSTVSINKGLDVSNPDNLKNLLNKTSIDYGGFWFFSFPVEMVRSIGFPLPVFKTIDDMEFGIRMTRDGKNKIICLPGIAVWHRTFDKLGHPMDIYFYLRNHLILHAIHFKPAYYRIVIASFAYLADKYRKSACLSTIHFCLTALRDFYKGPVFIKQTKPELILENTLAQNKKITDANMIKSICLSALFLLQWMMISFSHRKNWYAVCDEWQEKFEEFTSYEFWEDYLKDDQ